MADIHSERVAELHGRAFVVDAHFDLTYDLCNRRERGQRKVIEDIYLPPFKDGGFDLIVSAIFIDDYFLPEMGLRRALDQISHLHEELVESQGLAQICRTATEARTARKEGKIALFLSLEGADPLQNDLGLLRIFYELGVRGLGLTWSRRNYAADGSLFSAADEGQKGGLTAFGVQLVKKAEELGMFIDVSHLNDEGFWDLVEVASKPLIASHSNCRALAPTMRNLTDEQIRAITKSGGIIGLSSVDAFIRQDEPKVTVAHLVDHVDHIAHRFGIEHVGLGFDLCDGFINFLQLTPSIETRDVIVTHAGLAPFTAELITRGYSDDEILAVLGGNFMRVYTQLLG